MTIYRYIDGIQHAIELTEREQRDIFFEVETRFDREDMEHYLRKSNYLEERGLTSEQIEPYMKAIMEQYRKQLSANDWHENAEIALNRVLWENNVLPKSERTSEFPF